MSMQADNFQYTFPYRYFEARRTQNINTQYSHHGMCKDYKLVFDLIPLPLPSRTLYVAEGDIVQRNYKKQIQASRERHIRPLSAHRNVCSVDMIVSQPSTKTSYTFGPKRSSKQQIAPGSRRYGLEWGLTVSSSFL